MLGAKSFRFYLLDSLLLYSKPLGQQFVLQTEVKDDKVLFYNELVFVHTIY